MSQTKTGLNKKVAAKMSTPELLIEWVQAHAMKAAGELQLTTLRDTMLRRLRASGGSLTLPAPQHGLTFEIKLSCQHRREIDWKALYAQQLQERYPQSWEARMNETIEAHPMVDIPQINAPKIMYVGAAGAADEQSNAA